MTARKGSLPIRSVPAQNVSGHYKLAVGDYVELRAFQDSGANRTINANSSVWMSWLSD